MSALVHVPLQGEPRVDSRLVADTLHNKHRPLFALIQKYLDDFETLGKVIFEKTPSAESRTGQQEKYALLNEDQAYLLLTMARNTARTVDLKSRLIHEFAAARAGLKVLDPVFVQRKQAWEVANLESKARVVDCARGMGLRRREKRALEAEASALVGELQQQLFQKVELH